MTGGKPCKHCSKKRYGNLSICFQHYRIRCMQLRDEKTARKIAKKQRTKKFQQSETKKWWKKCWRLQSELVRRTGADQEGFDLCYTCDAKFHWKQLQAGHRHHRRLDFDTRNIKKQCWRCNGKQSRGGLSGNLGEYEHRLIKEYGFEWAAKLKLDANTHPGYQLHELKIIHAELKEKLASL